MFSFFRKKGATKDSKPEQQQTTSNFAEDRKEEEDRKLAENSKKKIKSDKKTIRDIKKVAFKSETEPVVINNDNSLASNVASISQKVSQVPPVIVLIAEDKDSTLISTKTLIDSSNRPDETEAVPLSTQPDDCAVFQQEEPPDVFCEAQEVIQPEINCILLPITLTESINHSDRADDAIISEISNRVLEKDLLNLNSDDKQSRCRRRVSFNDEETVISDPGDVNAKDSAIPDATHKLPITITQRDLREAASSTAPFLSEESSPLPSHETSSIITITAFILSSRVAHKKK